MNIDEQAVIVTGGASDAVLFLIGNGYMNGATLRLDGALRMAPR